MTPEFSRQVFEKYSNIKFHENPSSGSGVVSWGRIDRQTDRQTDRHDNSNSRLSQCRARACEQNPPDTLCDSSKFRSQWSRGLGRGSAEARLLGLRFRIPPGALRSVFCDCCVLSGRGLCVRPITRPEESCGVWCVWVWSWNLDNWGRGLANYPLCALEKKSQKRKQCCQWLHCNVVS